MDQRIAGDVRPRQVAIACQGGGSHAAYTAGALKTLLPQIVPPDGERTAFRLVGISGTSGGAICALLAWYGLLVGGAADAVRRLDAFWTENSTQGPFESLINQWLVSAIDLMPFELQLSPYTLPLLQAEYVATRLWPLAAQSWPLGAPVRADYFQLDKLIGRWIDFSLPEQVGLFWSVVRLLERWEIAAQRREDLPKVVAWEDQATLEKEILRRLDARHMLAKAAEQAPQGLLARAFLDRDSSADDNRWTAAAEALLDKMSEAVRQGQGFAADDAAALKQHVGNAIHHIPLLLLGAVDIGTGDFTAFSSERPAGEGGISENAVLASACLPWIFEAREFDWEVEPQDRACSDNPHKFWDGLFSQNPPIRDFISGRDERRKPDEVVAIQINPRRAKRRLDVAAHIWDRRNELAGNISLSQEISFIDAINQRLDLAEDGLQGGGESGEPRRKGAMREADRLIHVLRLPLDTERLERELGRPLGPASKLDRSARLKSLLMACGQSEARAFRAVRDFIQDYWNADGEDGDMSAALPPDLVDTVRALKGPPLRLTHILIDDIEIRHRGAVSVEDSYAVMVRWRAWSMGGATRLLVSGEAEFRVDDGAIAGGKIADVWITDRRAVQPPPPATERAAAETPPVAATGRRPSRSASRRKRAPEVSTLELAGSRPSRDDSTKSTDAPEDKT